MKRSFSAVRIPKTYLPLLLSFLFVDEICNNYILEIFSQYSATKVFFLYVIFLLTQIIAAPIQSGFSDRYCRRKSLLVSLSFSIISIIIILVSSNVYFSILSFFLIILAKGGFGNTLPMSLAGIADTKSPNTRFSMGLATAAMAAGYLVLLIFRMTLKQSILPYVLIVLFIVVVYVGVKYFFDVRDKDSKTTSVSSNEPKWKIALKEFRLVLEEPKLIKNEFKKPRPRWAIYTFLFWEISQYSIHMLNVDLQINRFSHLTTSMASGYLVGIIFLKILHKVSDSKMIRIGYLISLFSVLPFYFLLPFFDDTKIVMMICYFFFNLGAVFLAPSLFSILARERQSHEQGKIFGLLESTDTIAFLLSAIVTILYNSSKLPTVFIVSFSILILIFSWFVFSRFERIKHSDKFDSR